jgi:hypothetical protein
MRSSLCRLAEASANIPFSLSQASAQLIPPIPCVNLATTLPSTSRQLHPYISLTHPLADLTADPRLRLYRRLLRVHRYLPDDMRFMGDSYVKSEFRLTRDTDNPLHIIAFLSQWKVYLDQIESSILADASASTTDPKGKGKASGAGVGVGSEMWRGRKLDTTEFEKMSAEQVGQLYELMHATKDVWKS